MFLANEPHFSKINIRFEVHELAMVLRYTIIALPSSK